jgi:hypothetical protein
MAAQPNLLGLTTLAQKYHDTMVLYTAADPVECVVDGAPPGPRGRLFVVEPGKATKVPWEAGRFILEHLGYTGVVRVEETETDTGITYDIEKANAESLVKSEEEDQKRLGAYVEYCVKDKLENKRPVPAPPEAILRLIKRRNFDLRKYGIVPLGFQTPEEENQEVLKAENEDLRNQLSNLQGQMALLMEKMAVAPAPTPARRGKPREV